MIKNLRELYRYRELLAVMVWRDIKVKYKQSVMGFLWAILMPLIIVSAGIVVKYAISIVSGTPMKLFQLVTVSCSEQHLVTKIYFPKEVFPMAAVLSNVFDFLVASGLLAIILMISHTGASIHLGMFPCSSSFFWHW